MFATAVLNQGTNSIKPFAALLRSSRISLYFFNFQNTFSISFVTVCFADDWFYQVAAFLNYLFAGHRIIRRATHVHNVVKQNRAVV